MGLNDTNTNPGGQLRKIITAVAGEEAIDLTGGDSDGHPLVPCDTLNVGQDKTGGANMKIAWRAGDIAALNYTEIQAGFTFTFRKVRHTTMYVDTDADTTITAWN